MGKDAVEDARQVRGHYTCDECGTPLLDPATHEPLGGKAHTPKCSHRNGRSGGKSEWYWRIKAELDRAWHRGYQQAREDAGLTPDRSTT